MSEKQWIDNTDSYICPECNFEVRKPLADYNFICPKCGFYDRKDFTTSHDENDVKEYKEKLLEYVMQTIQAEKNAMGSIHDLASEEYHKGILYAFECMKMMLM